MKVMTLVGTRPEIIKLSCVIRELDSAVNHVLVHTGQNYDYELNQIFFEGLGLRKPDRFLEAAGEGAIETVSNVIAKSDAAMAAEAPDAVLLLGDTNSCLAAIAAKRRKIPIFHMEAGNRCFDERVPEEVNRRIVDHISDINMPYSEHARRYLLAEGIRPETIIKTGSPMKEVLASQRDSIAASTSLEQLGLEPSKFFLASMHREENVDDPQRLKQLLDAIDQLSTKHNKPVIISTHPRTRKRIEAGTSQYGGNLKFLKPFGFADYIKLQTQAYCVLSDSGTITEESSLLGFPAVMLRDTHERPEGMDEGTLIMSGCHPDRIADAVKVLTDRQARGASRPRVVPDYDFDRVGAKVVNIIMSYTDFVNRTVWRK